MFIFLYCLFVSISQVIDCEDRLRNDLYCVGWGVKLCSTNRLEEIRAIADTIKHGSPLA